MEVKILGYPYIVKVLDKKTFKRLHGKCWAITDTDERYIHFDNRHFSKRVIAHEVSHVFYHFMCQEELKLSQEAQEEFMCDFIGIHGEEIVRLTNEIYKKLK